MPALSRAARSEIVEMIAWPSAMSSEVLAQPAVHGEAERDAREQRQVREGAHVDRKEQMAAPQTKTADS